MSNRKKKRENPYDPALEAQAELERSNKRLYWTEWTLKGIGALLMLSVAKLHLSTLAGQVAGGVGFFCFLAASVASMLASSKENGPEYLSILKPRGDVDYHNQQKLEKRFAGR